MLRRTKGRHNATVPDDDVPPKRKAGRSQSPTRVDHVRRSVSEGDLNPLESSPGPGSTDALSELPWDSEGHGTAGVDYPCRR
jgi:hypothetical protein